MLKQVSQTVQLRQPKLSPQSQQKWLNPRKAATKLKDVNNNVEVMKKRFKALQVQDDYNRYKTIDHQKRISLHQDLHEKLTKDREFLRKSLQKVHNLTEIKEKSQLIRQSLKQRLKDARLNLSQEKSQRFQQINGQFVENLNKIKELKGKQLQKNRQVSMLVKFQQEKKRQSVSRHIQQKFKSIQVNKSIDSYSMQKKSMKQEQELSRLMQYQQQLLKKNSQSLQASQVMRHKFNQVFVNSISSNKSRLLPQIRARTNNSTHTNTNSNHSQL